MYKIFMDVRVTELLLFYSEDGGSKSLRNVGKIYQTAGHCKREQFSKFLSRGAEISLK
jgi:hypothetical protein